MKAILKIILFVIFVNCSSNPTYIGDKIELDFRNVRTIENGDWIEINGKRYTHYDTFDQNNKDSYSLKASSTKYFVNGNQINEPTNPFTLGLILVSRIDYNNRFENDTTYSIDNENRYLSHIDGRVFIISNVDNPLRITTSKDYPVKIVVHSL